MAQLANHRWERFSRLLATSGYTKKRAYEEAGFAGNSNGGNASVLSTKPEIQARVAELLDEQNASRTRFIDHSDMDHLSAVNAAAEQGVISREWIIAELMHNVKAARECGQHNASNVALKLLADISTAPLAEPAVRSGEPQITSEAILKLLENVKDSTDATH